MVPVCRLSVAGCALLFSRNPYQHHVYLSSANSIASAVYKTTNNVTSYFSLRDINEDLQHRNSDLELEIYKLKEVIRGYQQQIYADTMTVDSALTRYQFLIAHVINNSINHSHNYITIEKGRLDGVEPEMGVMDRTALSGLSTLWAITRRVSSQCSTPICAFPARSKARIR